MSVPAGAFAARHADSHGHRPQSRLDLDDQHLTWQCEQAIRNYDPCISCATHFLDLTVDRA